MDYKLPDAKARKAGMAAFRAKCLAAHERFSKDQSLSAQERAYQRMLCDSIKAAQRRFGEAS